jgi:hypothetical protein
VRSQCSAVLPTDPDRKRSKGHCEPRVSRPDPKGTPRWRVRRRWRGLWHAAGAARKGDPPRERARVACGGDDRALGPGGRGVLPGFAGDGAEPVAGYRAVREPSTTPHSRPGPDRSASRSRTPCGSAGTAPAERSRPLPSPGRPPKNTKVRRPQKPQNVRQSESVEATPSKTWLVHSRTRSAYSGSSPDWGTVGHWIVSLGAMMIAAAEAQRGRAMAGQTTPASTSAGRQTWQGSVKFELANGTPGGSHPRTPGHE